MVERFSRLSTFEMAVAALSVVIGAFLILDPLVLTAARGIDPEARRVFRVLTDLGKSKWVLIPSGAAIIGLAWAHARTRGLRRGVTYIYASKLLGFLFAAVALSGIASSLIKNIIGRARPKFFEDLGALEFRPFTFDHDFAAFPSGHATTMGALAAVLSIVWPCARIPVLIAAGWIASTRFLIGAHYFSDAVAGFAFGLAFTYILRNRLARRGWLFRRNQVGEVQLRGRTLLRAGTSAMSEKMRVFTAGAAGFLRPGGKPRP